MKFRDDEKGSDKDFVSLKDGDKIRGVFRGEVYEFYQHWIAKGQKPIFCKGRDLCEHCRSGQKGSFRFRLNLISKDGEGFTPRIFEGGWKMYQSLRDLHNGGYDLPKTLVEIKRTGAGQNDTVYSVLPVPGGTVSPETEQRISAITLIPLDHESQAKRNADAPSGTTHTADGAKFEDAPSW